MFTANSVSSTSWETSNPAYLAIVHKSFIAISVSVFRVLFEPMLPYLYKYCPMNRKVPENPSSKHLPQFSEIQLVKMKLKNTLNSTGSRDELTPNESSKSCKFCWNSWNMFTPNAVPSISKVEPSKSPKFCRKSWSKFFVFNLFKICLLCLLCLLRSKGDLTS